MSGWISVNRSITSHWVWNSEPYSKGQAWIDLLLHANHTNTKINIKGTILTINRGDQARSMVTLASQWKWSRDKVKRFLCVLESDGMIRQQTSQLTSIITICNYSSFQDGKAADKSADKSPNGQQTGSRQVTVNNDNNENNDLSMSSGDDASKPEKTIVPYMDIFDLFNQKCISLPSVMIRDEKRKAVIKSIWLMDARHQSIDFFNWFFDEVEKSDFLTGRKTEWKASFDWVLKPANFKKIIEGNYDGK